MSVACMLLGGALVVLGVLAGGIADRIRYGAQQHVMRNTSAPERETTDAVARGRSLRGRSSRSGATLPTTSTHERMARDVAAALVSSGYSKTEATKAVGACAGAECATLESWVRAALRRAMKVEAA
jgi:RuvA, C-terminal domain